MSKRLVLLLISLALLSGCGFKLRGNFELSPQLAEMYVDGGERELVDRLEEILEKSGSTMVDIETESATLFITNSEYEREVATSDAQGIATGYNFRYIVDFRVEAKDGTELLPTANISQFRTLNYDAGNELEVEDEEEFLKEEMEKEIVLQMMRRLSRI